VQEVQRCRAGAEHLKRLCRAGEEMVQSRIRDRAEQMQMW
jgi:hypothetical protein